MNLTNNNGSKSWYERIGNPARQALAEIGVETLESVTQFTYAQLVELHGIGPKALGILEEELKHHNLSFLHEKTNPLVDRYIQSFEGTIGTSLEELRTLIRFNLPLAQERMAYGMPTYWYKENLIHFAGYQNHLGLYPGPKAIEHFLHELEGYKCSKGAIHLPIHQPLPKVLLESIIDYQKNGK